MSVPGGSTRTIRDLVDWLTRAAEVMAQGLDTSLEIGVCDGADLFLANDVDVDDYAFMTGAGDVRREFVILRVHQHADGSSSGRTIRDVTADLDDELGQLLDDPDQTDE